MDITVCFDRAAVRSRSVLIGDARLFLEKIRSIRKPDIRINVLLIRRLAKDLRRELRLQLLRSDRIDSRRIGVAALTRHSVERDVFKALACRRRCQPFGDLCFSHEIALPRRIGRIVELFRKGVERLTYEVSIRSLRRLRLKPCTVRRQRDAAVCRCVLDVQIAAFDLLRARFLVRIENARMTAVAVNRDVLVILLEDHTHMIGIAAALQGAEMAARKGIVIIFADSITVFIQHRIAILLIRPYGTVLQLEVDLALTKSKTMQTGIPVHHGDIDAACLAHGADVAVQFYNMAACCAILSIDKDLTR